MSDLMSKLGKLMPQKPEPKEADTRIMARFELHPIRRSAEAFAHAIDYDLPDSREELLALLWVFGEILNGHMEKQVNYAMHLVDDAIACKPFPVMITPETKKPQP